MKFLFILALLVVQSHHSWTFGLFGIGDQVKAILRTDKYLTAPELIAKNKYPVETHHVTTSDGYILELHRIPHGKDANSSNVKGKPVLCVHGLVSSSASWISSGPKYAPGYFLADAGFDVWLGNCRGNAYSRKHTSLSTDSMKYWDFSYEESGLYDLPAMIDYILNYTGSPKLHFAGHSQGSTAFFVMASMLPEYNDKIYSAQHLGPVTVFSHAAPLVLEIFAAFAALAGDSARLLINEVFPVREVLLVVNNALVCNPTYKLFSVCLVVKPFWEQQMSNDKYLEDNLELVFKHFPAGGALKQILHYAQGINSNRFRRYDNGPIDNLRKYGSESPTEYNLSKIKGFMGVWYSLADIAAVKENVLSTVASLTSAQVEVYEVEDLTHFQFVCGTKTVSEVFNRVVECMRKHE